MLRPKKYFVVHLSPDDPRCHAEKHYEIQILDSQGRAAISGYVGESEIELVIEGLLIPKDVIEAARRQPAGQGDYVNECGESVHPF